MQHASLPRIPALDGLRGLAVAGVLAYHAGWSGARGGYLGVSLFFTLSGYLICTLLTQERERSGTIDLGRFWSRRARRLLPAALVALVLAVLVSTAPGIGQASELRGDVLAALGYVANWRFVLDGSSYAELGQGPSPVQHFWSLAIEEQFYLLFPFVVAFAGRWLRWVLAAALVASFASVAVVHGDAVRAYYGTDTRGAEVLIGALLALWVRDRPEPARAVAVAGPVALALILWSWAAVAHADARLHEGGLVLHAALVAVVIRACTGGGITAAVLAAPPLRWLGRISYGAYLYHWPLFLWLTPERTLLDGLPLAGVRLGLTLAAAELSHRLLEEPIRSGRRLVLVHARLALAGGVAAVVAVASVVGSPSTRTSTDLAFVGAPALIAPTGGADAQGPTPAPTERAGTSSRPTSHPSPVLPAREPSFQVATLVAAPTLDATPSVRPEGAPPPTVRAPGERLRVYVAGDSNALAVGTALEQWGSPRGVDVWTSGWLGCQLVPGGEYRYAGETAATTPKCDTWAEQRRAELADIRPHVVVVLTGTFDLLDRRLPGSERWEHVGEPGYDTLLRDEVARLADLVVHAGSQLVWATQPAVRTGMVDGVVPLVNHPEHALARVERFNEVVGEVLEDRAGATVVDLRGFLRRWPGGELDPRRRPDGVHPSGEELPAIAAWLGPQIAATPVP